MVNETEDAKQRNDANSSGWMFWTATTLLFLIAIGIRWVRLDLMTFRYDQAEVAFRAVKSFRGNFPLTGTVNSLGFHNAPGYVWSLLPAFLVSPDPRVATAWHGLLAASIVFPLAMLGRRYRHDALLWLPAVLGAVLPASVLAGRDLWAQYLLPPVAAWTLLMLDDVMNPDHPQSYRRRAAAVALAMSAWGISIHFSAALLFIIAAAYCVAAFKRRLKYLFPALLPACVILLTLIPSGTDWLRQVSNPAPKPDFVQVFEAILPDPLPWWIRVPDSAESVVSSSSLEALIGIDKQLSRNWIAAIKSYDTLVLSLILVSGAFALIMILRKKNDDQDKRRRFVGSLLLAWLLIPAVGGGLLVPRVNSGYFLGCLPAGWLLVLALPKRKHVPRPLWIGIVCVIFIGGVVVSCRFLTSVKESGFVSGPYYLTYKSQVDLIQFLRSKDVAPGRFLHLSGDWYQRSYDYIDKIVLPAKSTHPATSGNFALIEDKNLRPREPKHRNFFWTRSPFEFGDVGVLIFPSRGAAEVFARDYYDVNDSN